MGKHNQHAFRLYSRRAAIVIYDWIGAVVVALIAIVVLLTYILRVVGVDGDSMLPTLQDGERLLLTYNTDQYDQGDIIVIDRYNDEPLIKRVIAVGGDTVEINNTRVFVNNVELVEPYIQGTTVARDIKGKVAVPSGYVFVMGDNRSISKDSRMNEIGLISEKDIVGKARWCVWPPASFGTIYDDDEVRVPNAQ